MGFWDVVKNSIQGKPGFEAPKEDGWDNDAPTDDFAEDRKAKREQGGAEVPVASTDLDDYRGYKQIPIAGATRVKYNISGSNIEVWVTFRNQSQRSLELDKVSFLNLNTELDRQLQPGGEWEYRIYHGPKLSHDNHSKAQLYYKDIETGDYFRADHVIEYKYESDKTYSPNELKLITPIYDV